MAARSYRCPARRGPFRCIGTMHTILISPRTYECDSCGRVEEYGWERRLGREGHPDPYVKIKRAGRLYVGTLAETIEEMAER